jgi:hypothetical protein
MLHYWVIRQYDLRDLQARQSAYGLSSLARSQPHVEATLLLVRPAICARRTRPDRLRLRGGRCGVSWARGRTPRHRLGEPTFLGVPMSITSGVGAGGSIVAGITVGLSKGWPLEKAVCLGIAAGAAMLMTPGSARCTRRDVECLSRWHRILLMSLWLRADPALSHPVKTTSGIQSAAVPASTPRTEGSP